MTEMRHFPCLSETELACQEQNIKTRTSAGMMSPVIRVLISTPLLALKGLTGGIYQQILA